MARLIGYTPYLCWLAILLGYTIGHIYWLYLLGTFTGHTTWLHFLAITNGFTAGPYWLAIFTGARIGQNDILESFLGREIAKMTLREASWGDFSRWGHKWPQCPFGKLPGPISRAGARNCQNDPSGSLLKRFSRIGAKNYQNDPLGRFLGPFLALVPEIAKITF